MDGDQFKSFADVKVWLETRPGYRHKWRPDMDRFWDPFGTPYREYFVAFPCRPGDEAFTEEFAAKALYRIISQAIYGYPYIYERIPLEWDTQDIIRDDPSGNYYEFVTAEKFYSDTNWRLVKAYVRFSVNMRDVLKGDANAPVLSPAPSA